MNTGEILVAVRHALGETSEGFWKNAELLYWLNQAQNEHAQRAYSVKNVVYTTAIRGTQTYTFPVDFGELVSIRYHYDSYRDWDLEYTSRPIIRNWGCSGTEQGDPIAFFREQQDAYDVYGLFPIPSKPLVIENTFEGQCPAFARILDRTQTPPENFVNTFRIQITPDDAEVVHGTNLDPSCVYVSHIGLYMKREGTYYPGDMWLEVQGLPSGYTHTSATFPIEEVNARGEWIEFDFTQNPIEISPEGFEFELRILVSSEYVDADPHAYGGDGIVVGVEPDETGNAQQGTLFIEMHRHRNDIEVEYYRNSCDPLVEMIDVPNVPLRYHPTLVDMTLEKAYMKGGHNLQMSTQYGQKANGEMLLARAQAKVATMGSRNFMRRPSNLQPNIEYVGGGLAAGRFRIRFGSMLGG